MNLLDESWSQEQVHDYFQILQRQVSLTVGELIKASGHPLGEILSELGEDPVIKDFMVKTLGGTREIRAEGIVRLLFVARMADCLDSDDTFYTNIRTENVEKILARIPRDSVLANASEIKKFVNDVISEASKLFDTPELETMFLSEEARLARTSPTKKFLRKLHLADIVYMMKNRIDCFEVYHFATQFHNEHEDALTIIAPPVYSAITQRLIAERREAIRVVHGYVCGRKRFRS